MSGSVWAETGGWSLALGGGLVSSGDLFRVVTLDGAPRNWQPPAGGAFNAREFLVTLDEDLAVAAAIGWSCHPRWRARLDLSWGQMDATAEARVAQTVELFLWDRLTVTLAALSVEARLAATRLYPYALGGVALTAVSGGTDEALDQTQVGWRGGLGLHLGLDRTWGLRVELRDTWQQIETDSYNRDLATAAVRFSELGPQHLFELLAAARGAF